MTFDYHRPKVLKRDLDGNFIYLGQKIRPALGGGYEIIDGPDRVFTSVDLARIHIDKQQKKVST